MVKIAAMASKGDKKIVTRRIISTGFRIGN